MKYEYDYPMFNVTADIAVLKMFNKVYKILLIKRLNNPFKDCWALPGGYVEIDEEILDGAVRELREETSIIVAKDELIAIGCFDEINRDPRGRTISHFFVCRTNQEPIAGDDAKECAWFDLNDLPELAFDHKQMINKIKDDLL